MFYIFLFAFLIFFLFHFRYIKIKFHTFFKKGFKPNRGIFGVYCYCGKQGSGKTYSVVNYLLNNRDKKIYANVKSIEGLDYTYIETFDDLLALRSEHDCIIFYDEIFTALTKNDKVDTDILDFLSQMRKRKIIFMTTAQEWLEIPMTLRRYCRYQVDCEMRTIICIGILIKRMYDAEKMKWSNEDNDYVAPMIETVIEKCQLEVANSYDTFEQIKPTKKTKRGQCR